MESWSSLSVSTVGSDSWTDCLETFCPSVWTPNMFCCTFIECLLYHHCFGNAVHFLGSCITESESTDEWWEASIWLFFYTCAAWSSPYSKPQAMCNIWVAQLVSPKDSSGAMKTFACIVHFCGGVFVPWWCMEIHAISLEGQINVQHGLSLPRHLVSLGHVWDTSPSERSGPSGIVFSQPRSSNGCALHIASTSLQTPHQCICQSC